VRQPNLLNYQSSILYQNLLFCFGTLQQLVIYYVLVLSFDLLASYHRF